MTDLEAIQEKATKGEDLTDAEKMAIMEAPNEEPAPEIADNKKVDPEKVEPEKAPENREEEAEPETKEAEPEDDSDKDEEPLPSKEEGEKKEEEPDREKIEKELEKPYGQENLTGYSGKERALFFEMRRQRRRAQSAEEERDRLRFQKLLEEQKRKDKEEQDQTQKGEEDDGGDDFITKKDADEIANKAVQKALLSHKEQSEAQMKAMAMVVWTDKARKNAEADFDDVIAMADEYLDGDKEALAEVVDTVKAGGNPVLTTYNLLKAHPKWPEIQQKIQKAAAPKADDAKIHEERAKRLKDNEGKPRPLGGGAGAAASDEYTIQELLNMSEDDFAKLPPKKRDQIMKKHGI